MSEEGLAGIGGFEPKEPLNRRPLREQAIERLKFLYDAAIQDVTEAQEKYDNSKSALDEDTKALEEAKNVEEDLGKLVRSMGGMTEPKGITGNEILHPVPNPDDKMTDWIEYVLVDKRLTAEQIQYDLDATSCQVTISINGLKALLGREKRRFTKHVTMDGTVYSSVNYPPSK
jgi:hypothetical protein